MVMVDRGVCACTYHSFELDSNRLAHTDWLKPTKSDHGFNRIMDSSIVSVVCIKHFCIVSVWFYWRTTIMLLDPHTSFSFVVCLMSFLFIIV